MNPILTITTVILVGLSSVLITRSRENESRWIGRGVCSIAIVQLIVIYQLGWQPAILIGIGFTAANVLFYIIRAVPAIPPDI